MAEVRGYFQVAYKVSFLVLSPGVQPILSSHSLPCVVLNLNKRVIDNVPSIIDLHFVKLFAKGLLPFLIAKFGLGTAQAGTRCAAFLAEDPGIVARRDELVARKRRLETIETELYNFGL